MFQETLLRCLEVSDVSEVFVVTNKSQKFFVIGQIEELGYELPIENILIEPKGKNTLPAICFGMRAIKERFGRSVVGVFSSDHILDKKVMEIIKNAETLASDYLVTFGVVPKSPHSGFGYIKPAEVAGTGYRVSKFMEKPDHSDAKRYVEEGYLWNSGIFLFDSDVFSNELKIHEPAVFDAFETLGDTAIEIIYKNVPAVSIDYGILEKSMHVAVVRLDKKWSDIGNFDAMYDEFDKDETGNVIHNCDEIMINSTNNLICSKPNKIVSLIDVNNMVVMDTKDALLVCPRESSNKVKNIVTILKDWNDERAYIHETVYRPWGSYTILEKSERHKIKKITVLPEKSLSLQLHYHRSEHWVVVKGMGCLDVGGKKSFLRQGESTFMRAGDKHRLSNPGKIPLEIIEVQLGERVDENDIVRFDDDYGRM